MTNKEERREYKLSIQGIKLSVKFEHIILPFDMSILNKILEDLKYYPIQEQIPKGFSGLELVPVGRLAKREDLEVDFSSDKQVLGITGNHFDRVMDAFSELITTLIHTIKPIELKTLFYETLTSALVKGVKNPLETFNSKSKEFIKLLGFDKIFEEEVSPLGIRLSPSNKSVDHTDWFEYRIEPYLYRQTDLYFISYVFRNHDLEKVNRAIYNFQDLSKNVISTLENL